MGQQQLLLIVLGVIVVGIAVSVGVAQFGAHSTQANKDAVSASLIDLSADAYQYKIRPQTMGGGGGDYTDYAIPSKLSQDENGTYALGAIDATSVQFIGTSSINTDWVATCTMDDTGMTTFTFTGW
jgi:hypothetical protein